jgi:hypothetical protein
MPEVTTTSPSTPIHAPWALGNQPYAGVDLNPYARVDFISQSGTLDLASSNMLCYVMSIVGATELGTKLIINVIN